MQIVLVLGRYNRKLKPSTCKGVWEIFFFVTL